MKTEECLNKLLRLDAIIEKKSAYLSMTKKDLALWHIWYTRGKKLKIKILKQYTQQVSIDFADHLSSIVTNGDDLFSFEEEFINWIENK